MNTTKIPYAPFGARTPLRVSRASPVVLAAMVLAGASLAAPAFAENAPITLASVILGGTAPHAPNASANLAAHSDDGVVSGTRLAIATATSGHTNANGDQTAFVNGTVIAGATSLQAGIASTLQYAPPAAGAANVSADTTAIFTDRLTFNGRPEDAGRHVTLHGVLTLNEVSATHSETFGPGADDVSIDNSGIAGIFGGDLFQTDLGPEPGFHRVLDNVNGVTVDTTTAAPTLVNFTQDFIIGKTTLFELGLLVRGESIMRDANGQGFSSAAFNLGYGLTWDPNSFFLTSADADGHDTGRPVDGVTATSASGIGYLAQVGGGAVPEPATWALMIGGFGMAGAMLRRRRAVATAA